jgi:hypothetical protein
MRRWSRLPGLLAVVAALVVVAPAQGTPGLQQRVLRASDLPTFRVDRPLQIARSAAAWYHVKLSGRFKESAALQARGFVVAVREHLKGTNANAGAGSNVIEFKTARGARAMLAQTIPEMRAGSYALKRFAVPGIPGALGAATSAVPGKGIVIAFADRRFYYLLGVAYPTNAKQHPTRASVIAAARSLYRRVHSG